MVLLDDVVEVFRLAQIDGQAAVGLNAHDGGRVGAPKHQHQHEQDLERPAVHCGVVDEDSALGHPLPDVSKAQRVGRVPTHPHQHHFRRIASAEPLGAALEHLQTVKLHRLTGPARADRDRTTLFSPFAPGSTKRSCRWMASSQPHTTPTSRAGARASPPRSSAPCRASVRGARRPVRIHRGPLPRPAEEHGADRHAGGAKTVPHLNWRCDSSSTN
jgi:hypothetical protein